MLKKLKVLLSILTIAFIFCAPSGIHALSPGDSDYTTQKSVILSDILGDSFELVSTEAQAVLALDKAILPQGVWAVSFEAKAIEKTNPIFNRALDAIKGIADGEIELFDFSLLDMDKNTKITKLNGKLSITVACKEGINSVFYFDDQTAEIKDMQGVLSKNSKYITFETDHFSYFIMAKTAPEKETAMQLKTNTQPKQPAQMFQTRDTTPFVCISVLVLFCELLFTLKRALCK